MMQSVFGLLLLATLALGAPKPDPFPDSNLPCLAEQTALYDDLPWNEAGPNPIPSPYVRLDYDTVQVGQYPYSAPMIPASGNQYAISYGGTGSISAPKYVGNRGFFKGSKADKKTATESSHRSPCTLHATVAFHSQNALCISRVTRMARLLHAGN